MIVNQALLLDSSKGTQSIMQQLFVDADVHLDIAENENNVWHYLQKKQQKYSLIIVSYSELNDAGGEFVARLRALSDYATVPLILLVTEDNNGAYCQEYYASGFTQVVSHRELTFLQEYLAQLKDRDIFIETRTNKVVIIEDDKLQQLMVDQLLKTNHCECFCFTSAEEALACADSIDAQMIICDFYLQDQMTALDLIVHVKNDTHPWRYVPVMVMTGLHDMTRKRELIKAGANEYIAKPLDGMELVMRSENLLRYKYLFDKVEQQRKDMQFLAMRDPLTSLYNRYFLSEHVPIRLSEARRHRISYSMIVIDLDHFKQVNDRYGHDVGDKVLKATASLLQNNIRGDDVAARIGGEEFLMLLNHCDLQNAVKKAEYFRSALQQLKPEGIEITASFGVAHLNYERDTFDTLFKAADQASYRAKNDGRNCVKFVV